MQPPKPLLALGGEILTIDTLKKLASIHVRNLIFKDIEYKNIDENLSLDLSVANVWKIVSNLIFVHCQRGPSNGCFVCRKIKSIQSGKGC